MDLPSKSTHSMNPLANAILFFCLISAAMGLAIIITELFLP